MALTQDQIAIWLADQAAPSGSQAMVLHALRLRGAVDGGALVRAVRQLVNRHQELRLKIDDRSGTPEPVYAAPDDVPVTIEICPQAESAAEDWLQRRMFAAAKYRINLRRAPALSVRLLMVSASDCVLCFCGHHISFDDFSITVMLKDFGEYYTAEKSGAVAQIAPVDKDTAGEAPERHPDARFAATQRPMSLPWPGRGLRLPPDPETAAINLPFRATLDPATAQALRSVARRYKTTLFCLCAAAYQAVLGRYCMVDEVAVGVAFSLRANRSAFNEVGAWVSYVGVASQIGADQAIGAAASDFGHRLRSLRSGETACDLMGYSASIVRYLAPRAVPEMTGLDVEHFDLPADSVLVELATSLREVDEGLVILMRGRASLFSPADLKGLMAAYVALLEQVIADPATPMTASLPVPKAELARMAERAVNPPVAGSDVDLSVVFAKIAAGHPTAAAVSDQTKRLSYAEIQAGSQALARFMVDRYGLVAGDRVALLLHRGHRLALAHLAMLMAGLVIVPIDPAYPDDRIERIVGDSACRLLLCDSASTLERMRGLQSQWAFPLEISQLPDGVPASPAFAMPDVDAGAPAYVIYTSGSTGMPKGAIVPRRALVRLALGCFTHRPGLGDKITQCASPGFDGLFIELWGALLNGAELLCSSQPIETIDDFIRLLRDGKATHSFLTTAVFNLIIDEEPSVFATLRELAVGGEAMSAPHAARLMQCYPALHLSNVYGPTENGALSTAHHLLSPPDKGEIGVPIGRPLPGNMAFVLDENGNPVPDGFLGELWLGGPGLALGYDKNEAMSAARFCQFDAAKLGLADGPQVLLYRTGDRVRWDATGAAIEFHGRLDGQIKFNGFRIEPAEIEACMARVEGVRNAAIVALRNGPGGAVSTIVAVFGATDAESDPADIETALRTTLSDALPRYMQPRRYVFLPDGLPTNASGKIDRKALELAVNTGGAFAQDKAQRSGVDRKLATLWCQILGIDHALPEVDFFALGGHSILAMRLLSQIKRELGLAVSVADFLKQPTLELLEHRLRRARQNADQKRQTGSENITLLKSGPEDKAPLFCLPGLLGQPVWINAALSVMPDLGRPILGLMMPETAVFTTLAEAAEFFASEIIGWHKSRNLTEGPILAGFSMGGFLASAVTLALERSGFPPSKAILIDPNTNFFPSLHQDNQRDEENIATRISAMRRSHVLQPVQTRLDFVAATRGFPAARLRPGEDWAILARGGIALYPVDTFHLSLTLKSNAAALAEMLAGLVTGSLEQQIILRDSWTDEDLTALGMATQATFEGDYQRAFDAFGNLSGLACNHFAVRLQRLRLLEKLRDTDTICAEAEAMIACPDQVPPTEAIQMIESLDRLGQIALADRIDAAKLAPISDPTAGLLFQRAQRMLNRSLIDKAAPLLDHPALAAADPIEASLLRLMVQRRAETCDRTVWERDLLDALARRGVALAHFSATMRSILQKGDEMAAGLVLELAGKSFAGDPFLRDLAAIWKLRMARWT